MLILNQFQAKRSVIASTRSPYLLPTLLLGLSMMLAACSKPAEKTEDIRPVRIVTAAIEGAELQTEFSGEIRAKVESRLGFRVPGKIIARKVDVGTVVSVESSRNDTNEPQGILRATKVRTKLT